jgi:GTP cyclohydrolase I
MMVETPGCAASVGPECEASVSARIRDRIRSANVRFNANDNIASFIEPGEHEALLDEVAGKMRAVLDSLVIDTSYARKLVTA